MRTFIAIDLPREFAGDVAATARQLSTVVDGRFSPRENYHLTLAFLGEIGEAQARDAIGALDTACEGLPSVTLRPDGLGHFGRPHDATLWLGLAATDELRELHERVRAELAARGVAFDKKAFLPHITLARRARIPKGALPPLLFPAPARAEQVTLFKSTLTQDGPLYKPLYTATLKSE